MDGRWKCSMICCLQRHLLLRSTHVCVAWSFSLERLIKSSHFIPPLCSLTQPYPPSLYTLIKMPGTLRLGSIAPDFTAETTQWGQSYASLILWLGLTEHLLFFFSFVQRNYQVPRLDRWQLGYPLFSPRWLHTRLHYRIGRCRKVGTRIQEAQCQDYWIECQWHWLARQVDQGH